jgi:YggT family protein
VTASDLAAIINATVWVMTIAILARALMSWVPQIIDPRGPIAEFLITITEPILAPIRSIMPRMGMFDLTPMIAIILLRVVGSIIVSNLS